MVFLEMDKISQDFAGGLKCYRYSRIHRATLAYVLLTVHSDMVYPTRLFTGYDAVNVN